ncbi:MAG: leucine-rich repeat protein, partial [Methanomassiliicoccales archaeon]
MTIETLIADPIKASPPPQNLTATAGGASVVLTWEPPSSAGSSPIDGYEIYFGTNSTPSTLFTTVGNTTLTVDVTGLIPGTLYYFGVKAFNATGDGPMSNVVSATPYSSPGDFDYQLINSGTAVQITGYYGSGGAVAIPGMIDGRPVTSIGDWAFYDCPMTSVTIPGSVTSMGDSAFRECSAMTSLNIGSGVISIGPYAFYEDSALASVTVPSSVTSIGEGAFASCTAMTSVTIGSGVTSIGPYAFYACTHLTSVTIPSSVTTIGAHAFQSCT